MRLFHFVVRNAPLKVGALVLAIILYVAMVALQNTSQWPGTIAIDVINQPANSYLVSPQTLPPVDHIRYIAPPEVRISQSNFHATIDLTGVKPSESDTPLVRVQLVADDPRIQIIDYQPQQLSIRLDPIFSKTVPVVVAEGTYATNLQPGTPVATPNTVQVSGAASLVQQVAYAQAPVRIDNSGLDVSEDVDLVARSSTDALVENVSFTPRTVHVSIQVGSQLRSETVPISPVIINSPAAGYYVTSIDVQPSVVTVRGQADALAKLAGKASTKPISVGGATGDVSASVALDLPDGVTADLTIPVAVVVHLKSPDSTRSVTVGVVPDGARSDRVYTLSTPSVTVTLGGATAALNAFDTSTLVGKVSVGELAPGSYIVNVSVTLPPGIKLVVISPSSITVTVSNAPTPAPSGSPAV